MSSRIGVCCVAILMVIASVVSLETNSQGIEVNPQRANVARRLLQTEGEDPLVAIDRFIQQAQNKLTQPLTVVPDVSQVSQPAVPRPPGYKPLYYYNPLTGLSDNSDNPQP
jgi:citrate lyase alpha subunit